jgi:glycosyltransferase involved in cell wall biosynthesis
MNWGPNLEGINWVLDEIWNDLKELPVELHLAGREMPNSISKMADQQLKIYGNVADAILFMQQSDVMVVPLLSGSGMRVKIIEGMALGKIVITTTVGAEGIDCENGVHLLLADTPDEFYKHVKSLSENPDLCSQISTNARKLVEAKYDNNKIIFDLTAFFEKLVNN